MVPDARPVGRWEPAELGVHPVTGGGSHGSLPAYIRRPHDEVLRRVLDPEVADSRLIVLRGGACAGKSRAAYEAVADRLADWRLVYPPTSAALTALLAAGIPAWTVLWLGELRRYANADDGAVALSRLAELLGGESHLVITTVWPEHWEAYVTALGARRGAGDPACAAGRLITNLDEPAQFHEPNPAWGGVIDVPARFTAEEVTAAAVRGDPVLAAAAAAAGPGGQVTQYLAGGPALLRRYDGPDGDPYGQAMITAAMDAARLGHAGPLPAALVQAAAVGYLTHAPAAADAPPVSDAPAATDAAGRRADALAWASAQLDGATRALEPAPAPATPAGYRITAYLDQHGHHTRQDQLGPASLWDALTAQTAGASAGDLTRLGQAARDRGLYRHAAALWTAAVSAGSADAAARLVAHLREVNPEDAAPAARWAVDRVRLHDAWDLARLLEELRAAHAADALQALLARDPASQVSIKYDWDTIELLRALHAAGAAEAVDALAARVVEHVSLESLPAVASLLRALHAAGAGDAIRALVARDPARHADPETPQEIALLLEALHAAGAEDAVRTVAAWAASDAGLEAPQAVARLLKALHTVGAHDALQALLARDPVGHGTFEDPWEAAALLAELRAAGADDAVQALLDRDPASTCRVDYPDSVAWLLAELRAAGADEAIRTLLARDPVSYIADYDRDPQPLGQLAAELHAAGDTAAVRTLATLMAGWIWPGAVSYLAECLGEFRAAGDSGAIQILMARFPDVLDRLDDPGDVAWLLEELSAVGAGDAVQTLLDRDPASQARLDHTQDVAWLLRALRAAGAGQAAQALAARAAAGVPLEDPQATARLLEELHAAGAGDAIQALLARDPAGQVSLGPDQQRGVARLLTALRAAAAGAGAAPGARAGAGQAARALAARAADAGMFNLEEIRAGDRSGREPDGAAPPPWRWAELKLP
jgi:hypothetical protein